MAFHFFFSLFLLFLKDTQVTSKEVSKLFSCPRCLKGGFHPGILLFSFFTLGLPQGGFQPKIWPHVPHRGFHLGPLLFFLFFISSFFKNKSSLQEFGELQVETLPSTFTSLIMVLMNSSLNIDLL